MQASPLTFSKRGLLCLLIAGLCIAPALAAQDELAQARLSQQPLIVAHRSRQSPDQAENSLQQMQQIAKRQIGVEMDLSPSKDGVLYLLHDDTLDRTTTGHGLISAQDSHTLDTVHLKDGKGQVIDATLPRFSQVLDWAVSAPDVILMLDLKNTPAANVVPLLRAKGLLRRSILLTFTRPAAIQALGQAPDALVSVLVKDQSDVNYYRGLVGARQLAMYVPRTSKAKLYAQAKVAQAVVISDVLEDENVDIEPLASKARSQGCQAYHDYIDKLRIDVLVSNNPTCAAQTIK